MIEFKKQCPKCGKDQIYKSNGKLLRAIRENSNCRECRYKCCKHSKETRDKIGQYNKDLVRQSKIIQLLQPKAFWRYNSTTKTLTNVIGKGVK